MSQATPPSTPQQVSAAETAPPGLLHALLLDGLGGSSVLDWRAAQQAWLGGHPVWLHFDFEDRASQQWLEQLSGLNDIAYDALVTPETRPRVLRRGDNLLLTLRSVNTNPGADPADMVSVRVWTDGTRVVSTRKRRLSATEAILKDLQQGEGPENAAALLTHWSDRIVDLSSETLLGLDLSVTAIEEELLERSADSIRQELTAVRKRALTLRRYLLPQREALNRLTSDPPNWIDELTRLRLREIADRQTRHVEDLDQIRDRAQLAQEASNAHIAEQMNERSYFFTVVAVIFLPLGFLTGLLGINVGGMPGVEDPRAFWSVVSLCATLGVALSLWFRWRRWL